MHPDAVESLPPDPDDEHRARLRAVVLMLVGALVTLGLVMVYSASSARAQRSGHDWDYGFSQLQWLGIGLVGLFVVQRLPARFFRGIALPLAACCLMALVLVRIPGVGTRVNGAYRWFRIGGVNIQPSEFAKFAMILAVATLLARVPGGRPRFFRHVVGLFGLIALTAGLIALEPDLGTAALLGAVLTAMLLPGGASIMGLGLSAAAVAVPAAMWGYGHFGHLRSRLADWLDGTGFHTNVSVQAIGSGGWFGVGLGHGPAKLAYLPEAHTDFIFAMVGQELGFVGAAATVGLFAALSLVGLRLAACCPDRFGRLVVFGVTLLLGAQAVFNMGVVTGLLPPKGIQLPFVSYGGSGLCVNLALVGLMLSVSRGDPDASEAALPDDGDDVSLHEPLRVNHGDAA